MHDITTIPGAKAFRKELETVLAKFAAERGVTIKFGSGTVGDDGFTSKIIIAPVRSAEEAANKAGEEYALYAEALGLPADGFGKIILLKGIPYRISGVNPSRPKNCVKITRLRDGKGFICPPETATLALARLPKKASK